MNRSLVAALVLITEVLVAGYLALMAGLMSAWMMDDDQAFRMSEADWLVEGVRRFGIVLPVAVVFVVVAGFAHRRWVLVAVAPVRPPFWLRTVPALLGGCVVLASAVGATWFVISKPFI